MRRIYWDIETDGLLDKITKVHCIAIKVDGEPTRGFGPNQIAEAIALLDTADELVSHNGISFDHMAMWILHRWKAKPAVKITDTLVISCLIHADIFGGHSLAEWGKRVGVEKADYAGGWEAFSQEMLDYCIQDVDTLVAVHAQMMKDMRGWDWKQSLWVETEFAKCFARQAWRGVAVDVEHTQAFVNMTAAELVEISTKVEPLLPPRPGTKGQITEATPPKLQFKKDGTPSAATTKWFDRVWHPYAEGDKTCEEGVWLAEKYGSVHRLPTPMLEDGSARTPLQTEFPMKLSDQGHLKSWLMDGQPTNEARDTYTNLTWRPT